MKNVGTVHTSAQLRRGPSGSTAADERQVALHKAYPRRDAFSARLMNPRSGEVDLRADAARRPAATLDGLREAVTARGGADRAARARRRAPGHNCDKGPCKRAEATEKRQAMSASSAAAALAVAALLV